jgi:glycosyltransferase involved in cell wall biosynthesis
MPVWVLVTGMRLLVGLHHLELGGSQLNALDLAVTARDHGHHVVVFAVYQDEIGPVAEMVRAAGLPLVLVQDDRENQGFLPVRSTVARSLSRVVAKERIQLVHAYEEPLILDSFFGPHLRFGTPLVWTIYGTCVAWWLARYPQLIVGTHELADLAGPLRTQPPVLIEPPVNTDSDSAALVDGAAFRRAHGLGNDIVLGIVSRLEPHMKADGIKLAMDAMLILDDPRLRLVVTGEGPSFVDLSADAERINAALGRDAVVMTGPLADPRPAYAAADIALGMGSSALRAMAFGKPLIVLGMRGFAKPLVPAGAAEFLVGGFYGYGSGEFDPALLAASIRDFADRPELRAELGAFGRQLVWDRFSLKAACATLEDIYATAIDQKRVLGRRRMWEAVRVATCRTASEGLSDAAKDRLRPWIAPLFQRPGRG